MLYLQQDQPNTGYGFHPYDPNARPQSSLAQKQDYYRVFLVGYIKQHQWNTVLPAWAEVYFPMIADVTLPALPLLLLLPLGTLGLLARGLPGPGDRRGRRAVVGMLPIFILVYMGNTFFLEHYALLITPAIILLLLSAGRAGMGAAAMATPGLRRLSPPAYWPSASPLFRNSTSYGIQLMQSPMKRLCLLS